MSLTLIGAAVAVALTACATADPVASAQPQVEIRSGGHLVIWSAYLRNREDEAVVRGMARRAPLWRGSVTGHLDVTAYAANGQVLVRRATRWINAPGGAHPASTSYQVALGIPRRDVARLEVTYAPGVHQASEMSQ